MIRGARRRRRPGARAPCRSRPCRPATSSIRDARGASSVEAAAGERIAVADPAIDARRPRPAAWRAPPSAATTSADPSAQPGQAASRSAAARRVAVGEDRRPEAARPVRQAGARCRSTAPSGRIARLRDECRRPKRRRSARPRRRRPPAARRGRRGPRRSRSPERRPPGPSACRSARRRRTPTSSAASARPSELERPPERRRVGLVDRQVVAEDPDRQERRRDPVRASCGSTMTRSPAVTIPRPAAGVSRRASAPGHALERDDVVGRRGERRVPELVRLVEPVAAARRAFRYISAPVRNVVPAIDRPRRTAARTRHHRALAAWNAPSESTQGCRPSRRGSPASRRMLPPPVPVRDAKPVASATDARLRPVPETIDHPGIQRVLDAAARKGVTLDVTVFDESTHTAAGRRRGARRGARPDREVARLRRRRRRMATSSRSCASSRARTASISPGSRPSPASATCGGRPPARPTS